MKIATFTVTMPDDVIEAERINHPIICEEIKAAVLDSMILEDHQADGVVVVFRKIEDEKTFATH